MLKISLHITNEEAAVHGSERSEKLACQHPFSRRWQHRGEIWTCCACGRSFWGDKKDTPKVDIYGRAS